MTEIKLIEAPEWHYVGGPAEDPTFEPDITDVDVECALCAAGIGWVEYCDEGPHGEELEGHRWREYYEIRAEYVAGQPELEPTRLCDDCLGWVAQVGPDVAAYNEREQAVQAQRWATYQAGIQPARGLSR